MASALGVEARRDVQLVERALPLPEHAEQLEEEDAQLGISGFGAHLLLQLSQRRGGIPALQTLFGDIGEAHGVTSLKTSDFRLRTQTC